MVAARTRYVFHQPAIAQYSMTTDDSLTLFSPPFFTSTFVSGCGKFALRALSQCLAREFQAQGVHVAHVIIDGYIGVPRFVCFYLSPG